MSLNKRTKTGINVITAIIFCFLILLMINFITNRHYKKIDISKTQFYSLSEKTKKIIDSLKENINIIVFFQPENPLYNRIKSLLDVYQEHSNKIKVLYVDSARDFANTKTLALKYKVEQANVIVFEYKSNMKYVYQNEIAEYDFSPVYSGNPPIFKAFKGEQGFTSAILSVLNPDKQKIYFTIGHGEKSINDTDKNGISSAVQILKENNYDIEEINLLTKENLDKDIKFLIICGPVKTFMENEISLIRNFLNNKGRLGLFVDPLQYSGLENLLLEFGANIGNNIVVDPERKLPFVSPANLFISEYNNHEITNSIMKISTLYYLARSVTKNDEVKDYDIVELTKTSDSAWAEIDLDKSPFSFDQDKDIKGPVSIAVAVSGKEKNKNAKIVVVGDSDFISNNQIASLGNADFFTNIINWFNDKKEMIAISPKIPDRVSILFNASQMNMVFWLFIIGMPFLWVIAGVIVFIGRRK